ncbi:hypothetical protein GDN83_15355 [Gordonia jinghuaiqii]|uniref:Uncharacterized protein n=1 Tax=Gordonia jinghuaiqii TaxID=2758710 RepID=A0A7D7RAU1_9ACTN|nr:hypothetical protein [Gordonia jinghuaiqii]MCR5979090.1 hypothetical protein [Gordonia jinghuaiqii]QMT01590.1 hypothetical protein H1R19_22750 [Gordonia jinghuaiqii]
MIRHPKPTTAVTRPAAFSGPTASSPKWLTAVMRCDRALSSWFIGAGFFFAPVLLILDPWPFAVVIAWAAISISGLWLGLLGILMAAGLARVLRAGEEIPEEFWFGLLEYRAR